MRKLSIAVVGVSLVSLLASCVPARRTGGDGAETREAVGRDGSGKRRSTGSKQRGGSRPDGGGSAVGAGPDGSSGGSRHADGDEVLNVPPGKILGKANLGDDGALHVEETDRGIALRLVARAGKTVSVEPLARLTGPVKAGLFMGPRCRAAKDGASRVVALWTGETASCLATPEPMAVVAGRPPAAGCKVAYVEPGAYTLEVFGCGRYAEPKARVSFNLAPPEPAAEPAGRDGSSDGGSEEAGSGGGARKTRAGSSAR